MDGCNDTQMLAEVLSLRDGIQMDATFIRFLLLKYCELYIIFLLMLYKCAALLVFGSKFPIRRIKVSGCNVKKKKKV